MAPQAAGAQTSNAPPGNSGVDQYFESVPGAGGNRPSATQGGPAGRPLSPAAKRRLERLGADGRAAAAAAQATAPPAASGAKNGRKGSRSNDNGSGGHQQVLGTRSEGRTAPVAAVKALTGSGNGGMGIFLPLVLMASLVLAGAYLIARRRAPRAEA
jgi:hypothetical protein